METSGEPPIDAFFSGYHMGFKDLQSLALAVNPRFAARLKATGAGEQGYMIYIIEYHQWRVDVVPRGVRHKIPTMKIFHDRNHMLDERNVDPYYCKFFITTRYIPAPASSEMEDFAEAMHEGDDDKAKRDDFISVVQEYANYMVDKDSLRFGYFKDTHPYHEQYALGDYDSE